MAFSSKFSSGNPLTAAFKELGDTPRQNRRTADLTRFVQANKTLRLATFSGVHVFPDRIIKLPNIMGGMAGINEAPDEQPITGVSARVESDQAAPRATLTRSLLLGGWQKPGSSDARLVVTGPGFTWSVPVPKRDIAAARTFAAELTTHGQQR
ncbi:MAG: hypothetical protein L0I24_24350 [Pseudonocardia sp.]|nr:hypothetical protein [Pseudonocardia sp.]